MSDVPGETSIFVTTVERGLVSTIPLHLQSVSSSSSLACYPASPVSLWWPACHHSDCDGVQSGCASSSPGVLVSPLTASVDRCSSHWTRPPSSWLLFFSFLFFYNLLLPWLLRLFALTLLPATAPSSIIAALKKELWPNSYDWDFLVHFPELHFLRTRCLKTKLKHNKSGCTKGTKLHIMILSKWSLLYFLSLATATLTLLLVC